MPPKITWPERATRLDDRELVLWLLIHGNGRWDKVSKRLFFASFVADCEVDTIGLPVLDTLTRALLLEYYQAATAPPPTEPKEP